MTAVLISYPPAAGGNHLRNLITVASNYVSDTSFNENIMQQYFSSGKIMVHGQDIGQDAIANNINSFKLHRSAMEHEQNIVYFGHFAEILSQRDILLTLPNKKFILISPDTQDCMKIWSARAKKLGMAPVPGYYAGEQIFLYEPVIYYDVLKTKKTNVMNISIYEWFAEDISPVLDRLEFFLQANFDRELCQRLHQIWYSRNKPDVL